METTNEKNAIRKPSYSEPAQVKTVYRAVMTHCKRSKHFSVGIEGGKAQEDIFVLINALLITENRRRAAHGDPRFSYELVLTE